MRYSDQSLRVIVAPLRGGDLTRVRLSNRFSPDPVTFRSVHLGKQLSGGRLIPGSNRAVLFHGQAEVTVPGGAEVESDGVQLAFAAWERLAVSFFVPVPGGALQHAAASEFSFFSRPGAGDLAAREEPDGFTEVTTRGPFVVGVDVVGAWRDSVVAAIGDSITDGEYPQFLAGRLDDEPRGLSVIDLGIAGNRVLSDGALPGMGRSLLNRVAADVVGRADVTDVILLEGINDLGFSPDVPAQAVIDGLEAAVRVLKSSHLNVLVGTLTPAGGRAEEARRQAINEYIRSHGIGDGFIDFDRALRDPANASLLAAAHDSGDGLHPSPAGYQRMAAEVDLTKLKGRGCP
jgi:lysophospholipase L1-like esterase